MDTTSITVFWVIVLVLIIVALVRYARAHPPLPSSNAVLLPPLPPPTTKDKAQAGAMLGCITFIALIPALLIFLLIRACSPQSSTPTPAAPLTQSALNVTVAYACAQAMKLNLKDPSSAEFNDGMLNNDANTVFRNSSGFWQYNSYVIAKNSFNANTTTYFECQAEIEPDGQHAAVRNFQIKD